jgi:phosphatidylinositol alpha-mannosyltransferase
VRVALVSPYSRTSPGGVTRHVEALSRELLAQGHEAQILAPVARTVGIPVNGAISRLAWTPGDVARMRTELHGGRFDVVHLHSPEAPLLCWDALCSSPSPLVATFHAYNPGRVANGLAVLAGTRRRFNRIAVRIAVSESAAWMGRRFYGGRYRVIPNGVDLPDSHGLPRPGDGGPLELLFVGQAVERKGLPVLLRAFEALREHVPARLTLVGPTPEEIAPLVLDGRDIVALGRADDAEKARRLAAADVLCAPSLGGESFGMVLTEAFAYGTPVVASAIAGYRDVVSDGVDGLLVRPGDAAALAAALRDLAVQPARREAMGRAARRSAERYAWPRVAAEVVGAYEDALAAPVPATARGRAAVRLGLRPADGEPPVPPRRLPRPDPDPDPSSTPLVPAAVRRGLLAAAAIAVAGGAAVAVDRIGVDAIARSLVDSQPAWVLAGLGLMCLSMLMRAHAWHAILRAALPDGRVRFADATQGTLIGVLMSATLPARLGEPSRALIVARRLGRPRERLPVVLGTLVSQTLLNVVALVVLGVTMLSTVDLVTNNAALLGMTVAPVVVLLCVLVAPVLLRAGGPAAASAALRRVRDGLRVFRRPRLALRAAAAQLGAWAVQAAACWTLLVALGLDHRAGLAAAAAVLFAVNVTAVLPVMPSNLGVFQAACVAVLAGYGVHYADALAYGIVLQAVEIATAFVMGVPALIREGVSWREVRLRALHGTPVRLAPLESPARAGTNV